MQIVTVIKKSILFRSALALFMLAALNSTIAACKPDPNDPKSGSPFPPEWNPQNQALLPDKEFDTNWTEVDGWYRALNRGLSALWLSWDPGPSYISSPADENSSTMLGLSEGLQPGNGPRLLRCIFAKDLPGGVELDLIIKLYDGTSLIGEWVEDSVSDTWTTREFELKTEPASWDDLRVELTRQGDTTADEADLRRVNISVVEVEIPYPDTFTFPYLNPATTTHSPGSDTVKSPPGLQEGEVIFVCSFDGEPAEGFEPLHSQPSIEDD